jgi:hypothetical protein
MCVEAHLGLLLEMRMLSDGRFILRYLREGEAVMSIISLNLTTHGQPNALPETPLRSLLRVLLTAPIPGEDALTPRS